MAVAEEPGSSGPRTRYGVIALKPGNKRVALVRPSTAAAAGAPGAAADAARADGDGAPKLAPVVADGWQFPSVGAAARGERAELEAALEAAQQQLGLDVTPHLCSQPVIHALGPEPKQSTKFFMAFCLPEGAELAPQEGSGVADAHWVDLQELLAETAQQEITSSQLVAVLRQLQGMLKRRYELVFPADDSYQEVASAMCWHEAVQAGEGRGGGVDRWQGVAPKDFLEEHCREHKLPAPAFNVFEHGRTPGGATHFCATCLLPHLGLQITPDAVYPSPLDALECVSVLAILYLEGALAADCPLLHFAPAGEMASVPHAFITEYERRRTEAAQRGSSPADRKRELSWQVENPRQAAVAAAVAAQAGLDRSPKRLRPDKGPFTIGMALAQIGLDKNPLMALKEMSDKCRFAAPLYIEESASGGRTVVAVTIRQAGILSMRGAAQEDKKVAKTMAAQKVLSILRQRHPPGMPRLAAVLALLLAGQVLSASACSVYLLACKGWSPVSGRTEDFMPPAQHGYAGLTALNGSALMDGLNSEGLAAAFLWLEGSPFELHYDPTGPAHALAWVDLLPYLLGNFSSVKEAVAWVMSPVVQVTTDLPPAPFEHVLEGLGFRASQIPLHLSLQDAKGEVVLLEFGPDGPQVFWEAPGTSAGQHKSSVCRPQVPAWTSCGRRGATGQSVPGTFSAGDTVVSLLREHPTARYYFRSPVNPRWQGVALHDEDWSSYNGKPRVIELHANAEVWFGDLTIRKGACNTGGCSDTGVLVAVDAGAAAAQA
ncbi:choloylglycine hydrolase [Micractinium conductrix]|uniref:Choloylglycine hydrolase n=1 Tax=Micractinium conductrix TaxID=554055 RepID=A0A2P6VQU8_9CHLO|nr:choloylglycine hydrolase [Micractinium conductrix]|eukprot:PSC76435.1 choloylglycine hydrolase [Micractinium conductrix]